MQVPRAGDTLVTWDGEQLRCIRETEQARVFDREGEELELSVNALLAVDTGYIIPGEEQQP